ncbi:DUF6894 family protein [Mesorhizobium ciceri]|uniref:DUF6894 family protein n=1 Tax=Mesorhizobium TaxID=68287 RepID=UPI0004B03F94|nr:hypothetical protein [Mesorhizobium ciceri]
MPKFRFEFIEGMSQPAIFADMADRDEAVREAKRAAKEAMLDGIVDGVDPTSWVTKVYDEAGYLVATLGFQDLVAAPKDTEEFKGTEEPGVLRSGWSRVSPLSPSSQMLRPPVSGSCGRPFV